MIKILIIDDHAIVREGLKQILMETPDLEVAGEANNGQEALERLRAGHLDLVVLDISLPGANGLVVLQQIKNQFPEVPVLIQHTCRGAVCHAGLKARIGYRHSKGGWRWQVCESLANGKNGF